MRQLRLRQDAQRGRVMQDRWGTVPSGTQTAAALRAMRSEGSEADDFAADLEGLTPSADCPRPRKALVSHLSCFGFSQSRLQPRLIGAAECWFRFGG